MQNSHNDPGKDPRPLDIRLAELNAKNTAEHEMFKEYFSNDRRSIEELTKIVNKMSASVTEMAITQQNAAEIQNRILNKKGFLETKQGIFVLVFIMFVFVGLLTAAIGINVWNLARETQLMETLITP